MKTIAISLGTLSAIVIGWLAVATLKTTAHAATFAPEPVVHPVFDPGRIDREIAFHKGRVERDPKGALGWSMLSAAYLAKSREFDSDADAFRAEDAARMSLKLRRRNNASAAKHLVSSLLEQHRFQDALKAVADGMKIDPTDEGLPKLRIDILMEIGQYDKAKAEMAKLAADDAGRAALQARLWSLTGHHAEAASALDAAYRQLLANRDVNPEDLAWYEVKIGNELMAGGKNGEAEARFQEALRLHPRNYKARLSMAHLRLNEGKFQESVIWGEKVLEVTNSMEAKGVIAEAETKQGHEGEFAKWKANIVEQWRTEDAKFGRLGKGGPLHVRPEDRAFAMFCAAHHLKNPEALLAAKRDMANRPDATAARNLRALQ